MLKLTYKKYIASIAAAAIIAISAVGPAGAGMDELLPGYQELYVGGGMVQEDTGDPGIVAEQASASRQYMVGPGDTLSSIAGKFSVNPQALWAANALADPNFIKEGQVLAIPGNSAVHRVSAGENLWNISEKYRVYVKDLVEANNITNENMLAEGQLLKIPVVRDSNVVSSDVSRARSDATLIWPTLGWISSPYGARDGSFHHGIDIAADQGSSIRACGPGRVVWAGPMGTYGLTVMVDHGDGLVTLYAHTSKIIALRGQRVEAGEIVAQVGSTGRSTGPHLHVEVRYNQKTLDPLLFLNGRYYA